MKFPYIPPLSIDEFIASIKSKLTELELYFIDFK